jgi:hypothetical protein
MSKVCSLKKLLQENIFSVHAPWNQHWILNLTQIDLEKEEKMPLSMKGGLADCKAKILRR